MVGRLVTAGCISVAEGLPEAASLFIIYIGCDPFILDLSSYMKAIIELELDKWFLTKFLTDVGRY